MTLSPPDSPLGAPKLLPRRLREGRNCSRGGLREGRNRPKRMSEATFFGPRALVYAEFTPRATEFVMTNGWMNSHVYG